MRTIVAMIVTLGLSWAIGRLWSARLNRGLPQPCPLDGSWLPLGSFFAAEERRAEMDLGHHWSAGHDRHARYAVSYLPQTSELVALRTPVHAMVFGPAYQSTRGGLTTGVKVLGHLSWSELQQRCDLRQWSDRPDGMDLLVVAASTWPERPATLPGSVPEQVPGRPRDQPSDQAPAAMSLAGGVGADGDRVDRVGELTADGRGWRGGRAQDEPAPGARRRPRPRHRRSTGPAPWLSPLRGTGSTGPHPVPRSRRRRR